MIQGTEGSQQEAESLPEIIPQVTEPCLQELGMDPSQATNGIPSLAERTQSKSRFVTNKTVRK